MAAMPHKLYFLPQQTTYVCQQLAAKFRDPVVDQKEMSLDTANPPDNPKFQESCKSFDSYGEVRPTRNSFVGKGDKSFETVESGEDEDTTSIVAKHPANPYASASLISKILFLWPSAFIKQAVAGSDGNDDDAPAIQDSDLPDVLDCDSSETNRRKFQILWDQEKARAAKVMQQYDENAMRPSSKVTMPKAAASPSLARALKYDYLSSLWFVQIILCAYTMAKLCMALALGRLLQSFDEQDGNAYMWGCLLVGSAGTLLIAQHQVFFFTSQKGMQYRTMLVAAIFQKNFRLKSSAVDSKTSSSSGRAINLASNDVERLLFASYCAMFLIWGPLMSLGVLFVGIYIIGFAFAVGFFFLLFLVIPLQFWLSSKFTVLRRRTASITDERITLVAQVIEGVKVMKMYSYEKIFKAKIATCRKREIAAIKSFNFYRALNEAVFFAANLPTVVVIFLVKSYSGGALTPLGVFTSIVLINIAQVDIVKLLSWAVMGCSEAKVSADRIQAFLELPELSPATIECGVAPPLSLGNGEAIRVSDATCHWNSSNAYVALDNINVKFHFGAVTFVFGEIGSGKSALLQMLNGELPLSSGRIQTQAGSTIAYASQSPFIMQGTVRDNILFGRQYDEVAYQNVVVACGLDVDFAQMSEGEDTTVGSGTGLSGGQQARIALARALYRGSDILLLDDPLSAVDARVGKMLWTAIQDYAKRGKCIVLVTHQAHNFVSEQSTCIAMRGGQVACTGSYIECASSLGLSQVLSESRDDDEATDTVIPTVHPPESTSAISNEAQEETRNVGSVGMKTFISYCRAFPGGIFSAAALLTTFILAQSSVVACVVACAKWAVADNQRDSQIIATVIGLALSIGVLAVIRAFLYFYLVLEASKNLHDDMTSRVLRAKIGFFDTNSIGRVLNRFSADVGSNDDLLPVTLFDTLVAMFITLGALVPLFSVLPYTLIFLPLIFGAVMRVRSLFVKGSQELKRLEGIARSPIFHIIGESLDGVANIRANDALDYYRKKFREAHDAHGRAYFLLMASVRWFSFRVDASMFAFVGVATFTACVVNEKDWLDVDPSSLGLALCMLIQLTGVFQHGVRQSAEVANQMISVERVIEFMNLPTEAASSTQHDDELNDDWPSTGIVEVKDLNVRYRQGLPLSLKGLTFTIQGGSRVGVVGRSGSGKSTLVQALLRLLEAEDGRIVIDSVDISRLGLTKLRRSISVIPQVPVLYGGLSLRQNIDMFQDHSDEDIREALLHASMLDVVNSLPCGLDTVVVNGGLNFSVGQRQLLCLARAILLKSKVLVLDEPTANVDQRTDKLLQDAVAENFQGATIIAVAHRLDTVIDYDAILVLGSGCLLEFGSPHELIEQGGVFCSMVNDTGEMAGALKFQAKKHGKIAG